MNVVAPTYLRPPAMVLHAMGGRQQRDLAAQMKVSPQYLNDFLLGRRPLSVNMALAFERALGISARKLLIAQIDEDITRAECTPAPAPKRRKK